MSFGDQFMKAQKKQKLTNFKLAGKADLSPTTITRIKRGERSVTLDTLDKAAEALDLVVVVKLIPKESGAAAPSPAS